MKSYPQQAGEWLLNARTKHPEQPLSLLADLIPWGRLKVPKEETLGSYSREVYINELRVRSKQGDKYARAMLLAIEKGEKPSEDPAGD